MRRAAARYAEALARLLDLLSDPNAQALAITDCMQGCQRAADELAESEGKPEEAREDLERCKRLHAMVAAKTSEQLETTGERLTSVRLARKALPKPAQQEAAGLSCDMRA